MRQPITEDCIVCGEPVEFGYERYHDEAYHRELADLRDLIGSTSLSVDYGYGGEVVEYTDLVSVGDEAAKYMAPYIHELESLRAQVSQLRQLAHWQRECMTWMKMALGPLLTTHLYRLPDMPDHVRRVPEELNELWQDIRSEEVL